MIRLKIFYRESKGKYVLTAKGHGKCHHLLLIDERGKVIMMLWYKQYCKVIFR